MSDDEQGAVRYDAQTSERIVRFADLMSKSSLGSREMVADRKRGSAILAAPPRLKGGSGSGGKRGEFAENHSLAIAQTLITAHRDEEAEVWLSSVKRTEAPEASRLWAVLLERRGEYVAAQSQFIEAAELGDRLAVCRLLFSIYSHSRGDFYQLADYILSDRSAVDLHRGSELPSGSNKATVPSPTDCDTRDSETRELQGLASAIVMLCSKRVAESLSLLRELSLAGSSLAALCASSLSRTPDRTANFDARQYRVAADALKPRSPKMLYLGDGWIRQTVDLSDAARERVERPDGYDLRSTSLAGVTKWAVQFIIQYCQLRAGDNFHDHSGLQEKARRVFLSYLGPSDINAHAPLVAAYSAAREVFEFVKAEDSAATCRLQPDEREALVLRVMEISPEQIHKCLKRSHADVELLVRSACRSLNAQCGERGFVGLAEKLAAGEVVESEEQEISDASMRAASLSSLRTLGNSFARRRSYWQLDETQEMHRSWHSA